MIGGQASANALIGGAMIGAAAVMLMASTGRIAGISGLVEGVLGPWSQETRWRAAFLVGLVLSPFAVAAASGAMPHATYPHAAPLMVAGGLLVGFGTRLGGGCTSGHGVCGVARLSRRSIVATLVFMSTGVLTVAALRLAGV